MQVLYERGAFGAVETQGDGGNSWLAFVVGLPAYGLIKVFTPAFFARGDTRTPVQGGDRLSMVLNVAFNLILMQLFSSGWDCFGDRFVGLD